MRLEAEVSENKPSIFTRPPDCRRGRVGAGKTIGNTLLALRYVEEFPGIRVLMCAPTYQMLHDTTMHEFLARCRAVLSRRNVWGLYPEAVVDFGRGESQILFRAFDDAHKPRSLNLGLAIIDEGISARFDVILSVAERLRIRVCRIIYASRRTVVRVIHFYKTFVDAPNADRKVISCTSFDNPFCLPGILRASGPRSAVAHCTTDVWF